MWQTVVTPRKPLTQDGETLLYRCWCKFTLVFSPSSNFAQAFQHKQSKFIFHHSSQNIFCKRLQTSAWSILWEFYTNSLMERLSFLWSNLNSLTASLKVSTLFPGGPIRHRQTGRAQNIATIEVHFFACKAYSNKESLYCHQTRPQRELLHLSIMYKVPRGYFLWSDAV